MKQTPVRVSSKIVSTDQVYVVSSLIFETLTFSLSLPLPLSVTQAVINTMCGFGVQTQNYLEANKSIYPVGCADRAVMWIESHLLLVGALALGLALPQVTNTRALSSCEQSSNWQQCFATGNLRQFWAEI